jgi:hypothetical protein
MIANVNIADVDYSGSVVRGGVENITAELHDEDGNLSLGSATVNLSNIDGALAPLLEKVPGGVISIETEGLPLFEGRVKQGGFDYDFDQEKLKLSMIDTQKYVVDTLDKMLLTDLINKEDDNTILRPTTGTVRDAANPNTTKVVDFYRLPLIIAEILYEFNLVYGGDNEIVDAVIDVPMEYAIGGSLSSLPQMSCRTFLSEVARLINGFWWVDPQSRIFYMVPKQSLIEQRRGDDPIVLAVKKGSIKVSDEYGVPNLVNLTLANYDQIPAREIDWRNVAHGSVGSADFRFKRDVKVGFNGPRIALRRSTPVVIESDGDHNNYLVELSQESVGATVKHITAQKLVDRFYKFETDAVESVCLECVHSLLFNASLLAAWPTIYTHVKVPALGDKSFFVRTAAVDLDGETCDLHLVSYEPH